MIGPMSSTGSNDVPICMPCWIERDANGPEPVRVVSHRPRAERCFVCGGETRDGLYIHVQEATS